MQSFGEPVGRRERKRLVTREALVAAATTLFLRDGFAATTVARIAEAADVAPRTFFLHFASKEDILFHHVERYTERAVATITALGDGFTPWDAIQCSMGTLIDEFEAPGTGPDPLAPVRARVVSEGRGLPGSLARRLLALHTEVLTALGDRFPGVDLRRHAIHLGAAIGAVAAAAVGGTSPAGHTSTMRSALARAGEGFRSRASTSV